LTLEAFCPADEETAAVLSRGSSLARPE